MFVKKVTAFCLTILLSLLIVLASGCGAGFSHAVTVPPAENTNLADPVAIAADGGLVAVADNRGGSTKIHIFSDDGLNSAVSIGGTVKKMRIKGDLLFILQTDKFLIVNLKGEAETITAEAAFTSFDVNATHLFLTFGNYRIKRIEISGIEKNQINTANSGSTALGGINRILDIAVTASELQMVFENDEDALCYGNYTLPGFSNDGEPQAISNPDTKTIAAGNDLWLYEKNLSTVKVNEVNQPVLLGGSSLVIADIAYDASEGMTYILNTGGVNKVVYQYSYDAADGFTPTGIVLGSNSKPFALPYNEVLAGISGFKLAKVTGSDVYAYFPEKFNSDDNNFKQADGFYGHLSDGQVVVTLGEAASGFYFVWQSNKFSFVEADCLDFSDNGLVTEHATPVPMVTAAAGHRLYKLPAEASGSALPALAKDTDITVLADLTAAAFDGWHFVSVKDGSDRTVYGFMRSNTLKEPEPVIPPAALLDKYKANPPVLQSLKVYQFSDINSDVIAEIASGKDVSVFRGEKGGQWAKVEIYIDGVKAEGFVLSDQLIKNGISNTLAAGLVTAISVVLLMSLLAILNKRRKNYIQNQGTHPSVYEELEKLD